MVTDSFNSEFVGETRATNASGRHRTPHSKDRIETAFKEGGFTEVTTVGFRYLVDLLPPVVNSQPDHPARPALLDILQTEDALRGVLPPDTAKILLTTARTAS